MLHPQVVWSGGKTWGVGQEKGCPGPTMLSACSLHASPHLASCPVVISGHWDENLPVIPLLQASSVSIPPGMQPTLTLALSICSSPKAPGSFSPELPADLHLAFSSPPGHLASSYPSCPLAWPALPLSLTVWLLLSITGPLIFVPLLEACLLPTSSRAPGVMARATLWTVIFFSFSLHAWHAVDAQ